MAKQNQPDLGAVRGILSGAYFAPLRLHDWPAFLFGQPGLLNLEDDEAFDVFVRAAGALRTLRSGEVEGMAPARGLWTAVDSDAAVLLGHVLASLRGDRPMLFHRMLLSLPTLKDGKLNPADFELVEDFLAKALCHNLPLRQSASDEADVLAKRALRALGLEPGAEPAGLDQAVAAILAMPEAAQMGSDAELLLWLTSGAATQGLSAELAGAAVVEAWSRWVAAVTAQPEALDQLLALVPELALGWPELEAHQPEARSGSPIIHARCPFCAQLNRLRLGRGVEELGRCPHLVFVGTGDEAHLFEVLRHFDMGADTEALLSSYYDSPADLDLFSTIVNDMVEMLLVQNRLDSAPVECAEAPRAFYYLRAWFAAREEDGQTRH